MENNKLDRSLLIPIVVSVASLLGILLILLALRLSTLIGTDAVVPTDTPLKFQYLATEPGVVTLAPTPTGDDSTPTEFIIDTPVFNTDTPAFVDLATGTPTAALGLTSTSSPVGLPSATELKVAGLLVYDDTNTALIYSGDWLPQDNISGAYKNTLHLSNAIGAALQLSFTGQKVTITYQAGQGLGTVAVKIDQVEFALPESASEISTADWESPLLSLAPHTLTITHVSGGAVNVDAINIVQTFTSTPTPTGTLPTATPKP